MIDKVKREVDGRYHPLIETCGCEGQEHVFGWWEELDTLRKGQLLGQLEGVDFSLLSSLAQGGYSKGIPGTFEPVDAIPVPSTSFEHGGYQRAYERGEQALRAGEIAVFLVAGGQGSRLGFDGPKGCYPVTPITKKPLFQVFAERIDALQRRYSTRIPWYIMTSEANHDATRDYFAGKDSFGLEVRLFKQGMLPALDTEGRLVLEDKHRLFMSPDGHGGSIDALASSGSLDDMRERGIKQVFYFQVDNVLAKVADPAFLGYHLFEGAQVSCKVVEKVDPAEKVGIVGRVDGRLGLIEYTMLSEQAAHEREGSGKLKYRAGNIAIHCFSLDFLEEAAKSSADLPLYRQFKKVPFIDKGGTLVKPQEPNAYKFEKFIFDAISLADRSVVMEVERGEEFAPVKNARGVDSPQSAASLQNELYASWLESAGVRVPRNMDGSVAGRVEISPLFALDQQEVQSKVGSLELKPGFELYLG